MFVETGKHDNEKNDWPTVAGMRGEIGMGTMKSRLVRARMQYFRLKVQGESMLMREVIEDMKERNEGWWKNTKKCMDWAGITMDEVKQMTGSEVKKKIADRVAEKWREEVGSKSTLWLYTVQGL